MPRFVQGVAVGATPSISADASRRGWRLPAGKRKLAGALLAAFVFLALLRDAMDGTRALEHADVDPARHTPRGSHDLARDHAASRDARLLRPPLDADDHLASPESSLDVDERLRVPTAASAAASRPADPARLPDPSSCDAALVDKIDEIERQAARWQAMVLQRAREHAERAVSEARGVGGGASSAASTTTTGFALDANANANADGGVKWQKEVLGVLVPYRDRRDQLDVFASHMRTYLHARGVPFRIYVAEQTDAGAFNRGWALNAAFLFAEPEVDYVVFHDVDMLPLPGVDYRYDPRADVRHLSTRISQFGFSIPYDEYCSGAFVASKAFVRSINGFATQFWGWGGEDDEFCARVAKKKVGGFDAGKRSPGGLDAVFGRPDKSRGRFLSVGGGHEGTRQNPHWNGNKAKLDAFLRSPEEVNQKDGLSTTGEPRTILKGKVETDLYTVYRVAFPPSMKRPTARGRG